MAAFAAEHCYRLTNLEKRPAELCRRPHRLKEPLQQGQFQGQQRGQTRSRVSPDVVYTKVSRRGEVAEGDGLLNANPPLDYLRISWQILLFQLLLRLGNLTRVGSGSPIFCGAQGQSWGQRTGSDHSLTVTAHHDV